MRRTHLILVVLVAASALALAGLRLPAPLAVSAAQAAPPGPTVLQDGVPVDAAPDAPVPAVGVAQPAASAAVFVQSIAGADFTPTDSNLQYTNQGASVYLTTAVGGFGLRTWLDAPVGATITNVTFFYIDNVPAEGLEFRVQRYDVSSAAAPTDLVARSTVGLPDTSAVGSISVDLATDVDQAQYAYGLRVAFSTASANLRLVGARVTYAVPVLFLPMIRK
jgi:hypothetical protein